MSNDNRNGKGKYTSADGTFCDCNYLNNKRHGYGELRFSNGDVYKGSFIEGKRAGEGVYTFADGTVETGTFINDEFVEGIITYPSGKKKKYKKKNTSNKTVRDADNN